MSAQGGRDRPGRRDRFDSSGSSFSQGPGRAKSAKDDMRMGQATQEQNVLTEAGCGGIIGLPNNTLKGAKRNTTIWPNSR